MLLKKHHSDHRFLSRHKFRFFFFFHHQKGENIVMCKKFLSIFGMFFWPRKFHFCEVYQHSDDELLRLLLSIELWPEELEVFFWAPRVNLSSSAAASDLTALSEKKFKDNKFSLINYKWSFWLFISYNTKLGKLSYLKLSELFREARKL